MYTGVYNVTQNYITHASVHTAITTVISGQKNITDEH